MVRSLRVLAWQEQQMAADPTELDWRLRRPPELMTELGSGGSHVRARRSSTCIVSTLERAGVISGPEHRHVVLAEPLVGTHERRTLGPGLRDEEAIERVMVVEREVAHAPGMI